MNSEKHPLYVQFEEDWQMLRDFSKGERHVKAQGTTYLPATQSMILDGLDTTDMRAPGKLAYKSYLTRAVFHNFIAEAVAAMIGIMHSKPPVIEVPDSMKPLLERATPDGLSLAQLLRQINTEQILMGRVGVMADLPSSPVVGKPPIPHLATYCAESIINWDDGSFDPQYQNLNLVVLNESGPVRKTGFSWTNEEKYRILKLDGDVKDSFGQPKPEGTYVQGVSLGRPGNAENVNYIAPRVRGEAAPRIPFVMINALDITAKPDTPPLSSLANICAAIYRGEADYRQNLYMQGQDTLVVKGGVRNNLEPDAPLRTGAGARIDVDLQGDAKYIGVGAEGLDAQSKCIENDKNLAIDRSMQLLNPHRTQRESGEALHTRVSARTVTLYRLAQTGGEGLQTLLRTVAEWLGEDPKKVKVFPNLDFTDDSLSSKEFVELLTARAQGATISYESIHALMVERGLTTKTYEEELALVKKEGIIALPGANAAGDPTGSGGIAATKSAKTPSPGQTT